MAGSTLYTEIYTLVGESGNFPVDVTIDYKTSGPRRWAIIDIPAFTLPNGTAISALQAESTPTLADFNLVKNEILITARNYFEGQGLISPSFVLKSTTQPQSDPKPTPQQVNEQTQQETNKKNEQQVVTDVSKTDPKITQKNTPPNLKAQGADKLANVLNKKRSEIKRALIPLAVGILAKAGIKYLSASNIQQPNTCLPQDELEKLIRTRNQIVSRLNSIVKIIDTFTKVVTGLNLALTIATTVFSTLKKVRKAASLAVKFIPSPPGAPGIVVSTLNDLKDVQETVSIRLNKAAGALASVSLALSLINATLLKLIALLNAMDIYFKKCSKTPPELESLSPTLLELEKINKDIEESENTEETYNGFVLAIEEVPFSPTVNRRRAVAKNKTGIILLATPLSFTTENDVLINQLKNLIDANNLKAY